MEDEQRLSRIATQWSMVRQAHGQGDQQRYLAQQTLLDRYGGAVRRYLIAAFRDADAADEVFQDFALRFVRGDFQSANPEHGKFRSFLKTILFRMVTDHHRRNQRRRRHEIPVAEELPEVADAGVGGPGSEVDFTNSWREDLLARSWEQLHDAQRLGGGPFYTVLRCRVEYPDATSQELAERLSEQSEKDLTAGNVRVLVHRARDRFAEFLLKEVAASLDGESLDRLEQELIDLRLHDYCRDVLVRLRQRASFQEENHE
ncbi:MAG: sigma-70 family RNA polymerase sigma factor [Planctomycetaceae bacterium]|nr:MAG: sigma-70 family RNA polymerase sigma factor [Planctomycetaceae bacterium]